MTDHDEPRATRWFPFFRRSCLSGGFARRVVLEGEAGEEDYLGPPVARSCFLGDSARIGFQL